MKYRWLHLSDLHSHCDPIRTKIMRDALINEIKELNDEHPFSFILITGDISDKNQGYDKAEELIQQIISITGLPCSSVFIVPGNHDVDRKKPEDRNKIVEELWKVDILNDIEEKSIQQLLPGQDKFFEVYERILQRKYPNDKLHFAINFDNNVSIIHLNTSWMCYDSNVEEGKLHIGLSSVYSCLEEVKNMPINIAIGHHRISDLTETVGNSLKSMFQSKNVDLYLGGHCHKSLVIYDTSIDTEFCSCKQARAEDPNYPAGFIIGSIDSEEDQSSFLFYNWNINYSKWTYDYSVEPAKHGKYYLRGKKFNTKEIRNRDVIVDFKLFGFPLDYTSVKKKFKLKNTADYKYGHRNIRPKDKDDWNKYLGDLLNLFKSIIEIPTNNKLHIFPIAPIPLLVALGYLMQNNNANINIYQYDENNKEWVFDEKDDNIKIEEEYTSAGNNALALALSISAPVMESDISEIMEGKYDLLSVKVDNPRLSYLNYNADVLRVKKIVKEKLDSIHHIYKEIHLFLAAPAGLCIEIGRIIRENMYPDTFIYNFSNSKANSTRYTRIFNLKEITDMLN